MLTCLLLSVITITAENIVYLDYISVGVQKDNVLIYKQSNTETPSHTNVPSMDIQHAYLIVDGLNMTLKMKMGGPAILDVFTTYSFQAKFYFNNTFEIKIVAFGMKNPLDSRYDIYLYNHQKHNIYGGPTQPYTGFNRTVTHISGRYVYWNLSLTGLNKFIPINKLFTKYTIFKEIQSKYEIYPNLSGYVRTFKSNSTITDSFNVSQTNLPSMSKYF